MREGFMQVCPRCQLKYPEGTGRCFVDGATLAVLSDEHIGSRIAGRYLIEARLGEGGMAVVYRARHLLVDREVAVKLLNPRLANDPSLRERFRREAKNAAALAHPNIVEINDYGETDEGIAFMVMELLRGVALSERIARGPIPPKETAAIGIQIARGLARAHDFDVLHRDLKPDNIFLADAGDGGSPIAKILDFGIARSLHDERLTSTGELFGTPQYMAPERVTSIDAGAPADLYALGVILFEMVTGRLPFLSESLPGYLIMHMQDTPPDPRTFVPSCPPVLVDLIARLLEKRPEGRPVDAHQVIKDLKVLVPEESDRLVSRMSPSGMRAAAPTLPPTTLERWGKRTAIFDEMLRRAFAGREPPKAMLEKLDEIRRALKTLHELRSEGLSQQRTLEQVEDRTREQREQLGHAVHTLGEDLSLAREAARAARETIAPHLAAEAMAREVYDSTYERFAASGGAEKAARPSPELAGSLRALADAVDRWTAADVSAGKARCFVGSADQEVKDLEFQVHALRENLDTLEARFEDERRSLETALARRGREAERLEHALLHLAQSFCQPLRPNRELSELFVQLET